MQINFNLYSCLKPTISNRPRACYPKPCPQWFLLNQFFKLHQSLLVLVHRYSSCSLIYLKRPTTLQFVHAGLAESLQFLELLAIYHALWLTPEPCSLFTDNIYHTQLISPASLCVLQIGLLQPNHYQKLIIPLSLHNILGLIQVLLALCHPLICGFLHAPSHFFSNELYSMQPPLPISPISMFYYCPIV